MRLCPSGDRAIGRDKDVIKSKKVNIKYKVKTNKLNKLINK